MANATAPRERYYLQSDVEAAGNWDGLVEAVERGAEESMALRGVARVSCRHRRVTDA